MVDETIPRREFLKGAMVGTAALAGGNPAPAAAQTPAAAASDSADAAPLRTLTATEHAFIVAAVDTIIPADELSPSGSDCGVATFIDRQLAGAYGMGARLYRQGPFPKAKPGLGYQLALNPRAFFRAGVEQANPWTRKTYGNGLGALSQQDPTPTHKSTRDGQATHPTFPHRTFV